MRHRLQKLLHPTPLGSTPGSDRVDRYTVPSQYLGQVSAGSIEACGSSTTRLRAAGAESAVACADLDEHKGKAAAPGPCGRVGAAHCCAAPLEERRYCSGFLLPFSCRHSVG